MIIPAALNIKKGDFLLPLTYYIVIVRNDFSIICAIAVMRNGTLILSQN